MYKYLILFLLLLPITYSDNYNTNEIQNVYNISKCSGPIQIKVIGSEDIKFDRCILKGELFECQCTNNFNLNMITEKESNIIINIQYYTKYSKNISEQELLNYKRDVRLDNIKIIDNDKNIIEKIDIDPFKALFIGGVLVLVLFVILFRRYKKIIITPNNDDNDALNYITTEKEMEEFLKRQ